MSVPFDCQLALASLDEEQSQAQVQAERAKATSLHADLVSLLQQAQKEGVEVAKLTAGLSLP